MGTMLPNDTHLKIKKTDQHSTVFQISVDTNKFKTDTLTAISPKIDIFLKLVNTRLQNFNSTQIKFNVQSAKVANDPDIHKLRIRQGTLTTRQGTRTVNTVTRTCTSPVLTPSSTWTA